MKRGIFRAASVGGVAEILKIQPREAGMQTTVNPDPDSTGASTASGNVTFQFRTADSDYYETVYDSDGTTALSVSISSGSVTRTLPVKCEALKATSSNSGDSFTLSVR